MKKTILLAAMLLIPAKLALAQTGDEPRIAEEELVPWTPETGYSIIDWYRWQVDAMTQYSVEPQPGYVQWDEDCWYDPDDAYVIGPDGNIPVEVTPCGTVS